VSLVALVVLACLAVGYTLYGRFVARQYTLDDRRTTPAVSMNDGVDYVPTAKSYLLGQHFSAIAAAGPIAGPILACQLFGWGPSLLWIVLGVVFIGAVHDFSALVASVRHKASSVAELVRDHVSRRAYLAMMAFIWLALIYVLVAFADITASTFLGKTEELPGDVSFNPGGAVAMASLLYLLLSIVMGLVQRKLDPPLWLLTVIFVPATLAAVWAGTKLSTVLLMDGQSWGLVICVYCFVAALLPVWLLLQPRGYLGGFILYLSLAFGAIGLFFGGESIAQPAFKGWGGPTPTSALLPFLFVTIACGACSGFHGLVCSGTTSKQIDREAHCHPIGYGAMLLEAFVAVIALATIMIVAPAAGGKAASPTAIYAQGLGAFLAKLTPIDPIAATTFGAMVLSTFIFDTLDSATRLGRYILQELFGRDDRASGIAATALTVSVPLAFLLSSKQGSFRLFWTLFGTSNQLLAALTLLAITVWLRKLGKPIWYTVLPMVLVMAVTVVALVLQMRTLVEATAGSAPWINGLVSAVLLALAATLVVFAARAWRAPLAR
jgi:carbon starvation protein